MFIDFRERKGKGGERGRERQRKRESERNIDWLTSVHVLNGDQTCNLGLYAGQESKLQSFGVRDDASTN